MLLGCRDRVIDTRSRGPCLTCYAQHAAETPSPVKLLLSNQVQNERKQKRSLGSASIAHVKAFELLYGPRVFVALPVIATAACWSVESRSPKLLSDIMGTNTPGSKPTSREDLSKHEDATSSPVLVLPCLFDRQESAPTATPLAPPPSSKTPRPSPTKSHSRLSSDPGLEFHNRAAPGQSTEYGPGRRRALSVGGSGTMEDPPRGTMTGAEGGRPTARSRLLPDFFDPAFVKLAFSDPETGRRIRMFAESRNDAVDMHFLEKVGPGFLLLPPPHGLIIIPAC